jgi:hypothetical protein
LLTIVLALVAGAFCSRNGRSAFVGDEERRDCRRLVVVVEIPTVAHVRKVLSRYAQEGAMGINEKQRGEGKANTSHRRGYSRAFVPTRGTRLPIFYPKHQQGK